MFKMETNSNPDEAASRLLQRYEHAVNAGDWDEATRITGEFVGVAEEWCLQHPTRDFELTVQGAACEAKGDWSGAESAYREILALPEIEPHVECGARSRLSQLYHLLNRKAEALREAQLATAAARRLELAISQSTALQCEASLLLWVDRPEEAEPLIAEALSLLGDDEMYNQQRAGALTLQAWCEVQCGRLVDAEQNLNAALCLLRPMADWEIAAGVHFDLARWSAVSARHQAARGDLQGAVIAWREALDRTRHVASLPQVEGVRAHFSVAVVLHELAKALSVAGQRAEAMELEAQRKTILDRFGIPVE